MEKEKIKLFLLIDYMISYIKNFKESTKVKLLELMSQQGFRIQDLYTKVNEQPKNEIKEIISFIIISKMIKTQELI